MLREVVLMGYVRADLQIHLAQHKQKISLQRKNIKHATITVATEVLFIKLLNVVNEF